MYCACSCRRRIKVRVDALEAQSCGCLHCFCEPAIRTFGALGCRLRVPRESMHLSAVRASPEPVMQQSALGGLSTTVVCRPASRDSAPRSLSWEATHYFAVAMNSCSVESACADDATAWMRLEVRSHCVQRHAGSVRLSLAQPGPSLLALALALVHAHAHAAVVSSRRRVWSRHDEAFASDGGYSAEAGVGGASALRAASMWSPGAWPRSRPWSRTLVAAREPRRNTFSPVFRKKKEPVSRSARSGSLRRSQIFAVTFQS